jgi:photosystem II stability/assembly factor-like uncharacterized protein
MRRRIFDLVLGLALLLISLAAQGASWKPVGPDGGDVRSLADDPRDADRILLGTSAGQLFESRDGGENWLRLAHLGDQDQYVLDNILFDPARPGTIYVAAWDVEGSNGGGLFVSRDDGRAWQEVPALRGKSIRAFAMAPSDSRILVAGALDGVYRSTDRAATWARISPEDDPEIKNIESLAIDPRNPELIYVGTWHLPWKTIDAGRTWISIKKGWIDDSDVFSIAIDQHKPDVVFASACTGVYRSDNGAALFQKLKGIPKSARRTRKLELHPDDGNIVYAGTTEGLYRSINGGATWKLISSPSVIVNDILVDARRPGRVLLATDRSGVLRSENGGRSFFPSNHGFAHRQVAALLVDHNDPNVIYAGIINDKDFGGVFVSRDAGEHWKQSSEGLDDRDVFALQQTADGVLLAGTNRGLFFLDSRSRRWRPLNWQETPARPVVRGRASRAARITREVSVISPIENARISDLQIVDNGTWYAATSVGLFSSHDAGHTWQGGPVLNTRNLVAVHVVGKVIEALTSRRLLLSIDGGSTWYAANLPPFVTELFGATLDGEGTLWVATREGAFRSSNGGEAWEHVLGGLPGRDVTSLLYSAESKLLIATAQTGVYQSADNGSTWNRTGDTSWHMRGVSLGGGRIFANSTFDGVMVLSEPSANASISSGTTAGTSE